MDSEKTSTTIMVLVILLSISSFFILSFPYPLHEKSMRPGVHPIWTGGTIPDEHSYFGWAQIYYETGKTYIPLEEVGPSKIQHVDFFIGNNPKECIFAKVDVSRDAQSSLQWETKSRDITITVYDGNDEGRPGIPVEIIEQKKQLHWNKVTDIDGIVSLDDVPPGFYNVLVETPVKQLKIFFSTDYLNINYPIEATAHLHKFTSSHVEVLIHVDHYINSNLKDVDVYLGFTVNQNPPIASTDERGDCLIHLPLKSDMYHIVAVKETAGIFPPVASGVVEIDGTYALANHWPPGYCYFIIPFWITGMIYYLPVFLSAITCISVYVLAKRLYDHKTAFLASIFAITTGLTMLILYSRGLADYAAMAFATVGITLFIESMQNHKKNGQNLGFALMGLLGGLSFAFAVTMRYSTVVLLCGPITYVFLKIIRTPSSQTTSLNHRTRTLFRIWNNFCIFLKKSFPFIIGLLLIGCLLAHYNTVLFGGPLNSGYQTSIQVETTGDNVTIEKPNQTMFQKYFNPSLESLQNLFERILPQLFYLLPTLFIIPLAVILDRKRTRTWLLFIWALPILVIYMQLKWVGKIPMEDMRYFLPVLPPTAILTSYTMITLFSKYNGSEYKSGYFFMFFLVALFILTGFIMAHYGITWQLNRRELGLIFSPPFLPLILLLIFYGSIYGKAVIKKLV